MSERPVQVLVIEDDEAMRAMLVQMLHRLGYDVIPAANGRIALDLLKTATPDFVITDLLMPEKDGIETILELRRSAPSLRVIAISGGGRLSSADYLHMARKLGAVATLEKPFEREQLKAVLEQLRVSRASTEVPRSSPGR
ncbi:MAG: response regulator [Opitutaceae bacterium]|nr:response regulator [Opitutaceae bacterium]